MTDKCQILLVCLIVTPLIVHKYPMESLLYHIALCMKSGFPLTSHLAVEALKTKADRSETSVPVIFSLCNALPVSWYERW